MTRRTRGVLLLLVPLVGLATSQLGGQAPHTPGLPAPPVARVVPRVDTLHGDVRVDPYNWLRARSNPEVLRYLEDENRYADTAMATTRALQDSLYREFRARTVEADLSAPTLVAPYYYYNRTEAGKQYPIYARRRGSLTAPEEVYLDVNALAAGRKYLRLGRRPTSPDHRWLAFTVDTTGAQQFTLLIKDLATGAVLPDRVPRVVDVVWAADGRTLFYSRSDSISNRSRTVFRHVMGTPAAQDVQVFDEPDPQSYVELTRTKDSRYLLVRSWNRVSSETRFVPAATPDAPLRVLAPRRPNVLYTVEHAGDQFLIRTNEGAPNFRLMSAPDRTPERAHWRELVPAQDSVLLESVHPFRDHLVLLERGRAEVAVRVIDRRSGRSHRVRFEEPVHVVSVNANPGYATPLVRLTYSSPLTPPVVYDYDMAARTLTVVKRTAAPDGYDRTSYRAERVWARAPDGARVPVTLVYRAPLTRDGRRPFYLIGYGAYGVSLEPTFRSTAFSLLDRGVVFALAHVRGGQELGRLWYEDGRLFRKRNTFTDFIAVASHLVDERYTSPAHLVIRGGSAGGLLVGAVLNMRPDLFGAAIADVPFVDAITGMLDPTGQDVAPEWEEWGDPRRPADYRYMRSYSPYDNVERRPYPAILVNAGFNDAGTSTEGAKWVAKLRALKTDQNLLLLRTNMVAGHFGASGRYDALRSSAFDFAFVLKSLGLTSPRPADEQRQPPASPAPGGIAHRL